VSRLSIEHLSLRFAQPGGEIHALSDVSLTLAPGEILSLVGESGCGKSVTAMSVLRLLPRDGVHLTGRILFDGQDLLALPERRMAALRGNRIGMIFQDPMTSLTPVHSIGRQIAETVRRHRGEGWAAARARAREMLDLVRIPDARRRLDAYPHELSGGMRQRVMIAMALACAPEILIADEPTTALDVTVQAQILQLIRELRADLGMSVILITHDLGVVAETADRVAVMYAGRVVEEAPTARLFAQPSHGYTAGLLQALSGRGTAHHRQPLTEIPGSVPRLDRVETGCVYAPRCAFARAECRQPLPPPATVGPGHLTACIRAEAVAAEAGQTEIARAWA
jgi:peptide/nickel transport system ATP-binding protein